jgi:hypothetical protein
MVDRDLHLLVTDLRVLEHLRQAHHAAARHACRIEHADPVLDRLPADLFVDDRVDRSAPLEAPGIGVELGWSRKCDSPSASRSFAYTMSLDGCDRDLPSFASNRPYGATSPWSLPCAGGCSPVPK